MARLAERNRFDEFRRIVVAPVGEPGGDATLSGIIIGERGLGLPREPAL